MIGAEKAIKLRKTRAVQELFLLLGFMFGENLSHAISKNRITVSPCLSIFTSVHGATISRVSRFV